MAIQDGDIIRINITTMIKSTGEVYSSTIEEVAKEIGRYDENGVYGDFPVIVGRTNLFQDVTEALIGVDVGDKISVEVPSEHVGQRDPNLVQVSSVKEFKKQGINPVQGLYIQNNGNTGKILKVNGGRVTVDYNNELAGKSLICDVEVCSIVEGDEEKIKAIIESIYVSNSMNYENTKISRDGNILNIVLDPPYKFDKEPTLNITLKKFEIAREIYTIFDDIEQVNFVDEFVKKN